MPRKTLCPSYAIDQTDWQRALSELEGPASPVVFWSWHAFDNRPWPIETRPFVLCDENESRRHGLPIVDLFLYSDPNPRLYTDLRRVYGDGQTPGLRGMTTIFRDDLEGIEVDLTEMMPLTLRDGAGLAEDASNLAAAVGWTSPAEHEKFLFNLLRVDTTYRDGVSDDETHLVLYTPLPPHRVVELLLPLLGERTPTYLLDAGRGARECRGPHGFTTMADWLSATPPRYLIAPDDLAVGRQRVPSGFKLPRSPNDHAGALHLFRGR